MSEQNSTEIIKARVEEIKKLQQTTPGEAEADQSAHQNLTRRIEDIQSVLVKIQTGGLKARPPGGTRLTINEDHVILLAAGATPPHIESTLAEYELKPGRILTIQPTSFHSLPPWHIDFTLEEMHLLEGNFEGHPPLIEHNNYRRLTTWGAEVLDASLSLYELVLKQRKQNT